MKNTKTTHHNHSDEREHDSKIKYYTTFEISVLNFIYLMNWCKLILTAILIQKKKKKIIYITVLKHHEILF